MHISGVLVVLFSVFIARSFWNIVVITACDDEQKSIYEQQLELKKARNELPRIRYWVK